VSNVNLTEIAEIRMGHGFRGAVITDPEAGSRVIQMRNVDLAGGVSWSELESCNPPGRREPDWLQQDDIIFQARGRRNLAIRLNTLPFDRVVCTQHFLVIRVKDERFTPAFVAWQLNQQPAQDHFDLSTPDSHTRHITLATLAATPISHADMATQTQLEQLIDLTRREQQLFESLMTNRQQQMATVASQIMQKGDGV
jgi:hypothetical protein